MARLQILELPEGSGDDRPPFVLVVDEVATGPDGELLIKSSDFEGVAERIGARAILSFEETIDIPANDTSAYLAQAEEQADPEHVDERAIRVEAQLEAYIEKREAIEQDRKTALLDALGMDRTRDWDDIRNAARGLRRQRDAQAAELERMQAGEEPVTDNRIAPTPAQWIWQWNRATPEKRLSMAAQILDGMAKANDCFMADHEAEIANLRAEVERLRSESADGTPDA